MKVFVCLIGIVMGIMVIVGFFLEMFIYVLFGYWFDVYKVQGYIYMFIFMGVMFVFVVFILFLFFCNVKMVFKKMDGKLVDIFWIVVE